MRIYLNTSALNRPFDDLYVAKVRTEAEAVLLLVAEVEVGCAEPRPNCRSASVGLHELQRPLVDVPDRLTRRPRVSVHEVLHQERDVRRFWVDAGIARAAAGLLRDPVDNTWKGAALETLVFHEIRVHNLVAAKHRPIAYYRTSAGAEIDFVIESRKRQGDNPPRLVCVEVKLAPRWQRKWERSIRALGALESVEIARMVGVYTGEREYHFDGLDVMPVGRFLQRLHAGEVF